jgi:hypothetical protein
MLNLSRLSYSNIPPVPILPASPLTSFPSNPSSPHPNVHPIIPLLLSLPFILSSHYTEATLCLASTTPSSLVTQRRGFAFSRARTSSLWRTSLLPHTGYKPLQRGDVILILVVHIPSDLFISNHLHLISPHCTLL